MDSKNYTVIAFPENSAVVIRSRCLDGDVTEFKAVDPGHSGSYNPFSPLQFFSAFDSTGNHLGTWSPGYPDWGWEKYDHPSCTPGRACGDLLTLRRLALADADALAVQRWNRILAGDCILVPTAAAGAKL